MKRLGYKEVLLTLEELSELSNGDLTTSNIKVYCSRSGGARNSNFWVNVPDPSDGRKILVRYTTIPLNTVKKYNLPPVTVLIDRIKSKAALDQVDQQQQKIDFHIYKLEDQVKNAAENEFVKYSRQYREIFPADQNKAILYAKTHAVLQCCIDLKAGYTITLLHEAYLKTVGVKHSLKNRLKFGVRLKEWEKTGISIVHKCAGSPRAHLVKLTQWHIGKIEQYYAHPNKYSHRLIHEMLTNDCVSNGKTIVQYDTVSKYCSRPEVKNRLAVYRDKEYFRRNVLASTRRSAPLFSGDLYYADGSPLQMTCLDQAGKSIVRLNLFVVLDVKSKKIVGFDLAMSEDRYNWFAAFKMAFQTEMMVPYEMMYDNASATKTEEFKALKESLALRGCNLNPTTKGEPKQKADVERWFETFQSTCQRMIEGFVGEGIRTKRDNGRIDVEHLAHLQKANGQYTYNEMLEIVTKLIAIYNSNPDGKGHVPNEVYKQSDKPNCSKITAPDLAILFWLHKKLKVQNSEIEMTIRHNTYYYEVYDHATALGLDGGKVNVYYDETDLSKVHIFNMNGTYICECRQKIAFHKAKANQTEADVIQIIKQSKHNEAKRTVAKAISSRIAEAAMVGNEETFLLTANPYEVSYKSTANDSETKLMLAYVQDQKGVTFKDTYRPISAKELPRPAKSKQTLQERHAKKNIVPATLQVINRK